MRHFLTELDFSVEEAAAVFEKAREYKALGNKTPAVLDRQSWGMLFFKNSTRTRVSFEVGIHQLGGQAVILNSQSTQLNRGETIADTAKVLSRYLSGIIIRCYEHSVLEEFASEGSIPVVNALSDFLHPCQIYSDLFTLAERWAGPKGDLLASLKGRKLAFFGDTACNMANSWLLAARHFGLEVVLAGPEAYAPGPEIRKLLGTDKLPFTSDPLEAAKDADVIYTDVWVSMGNEEEEKSRIATMQPYAVTGDILKAARPDAFFMHCLPAHPGLEVTQEVLDSPCSIIFDQAENRLHMQKAILASLVG